MVSLYVYNKKKLLFRQKKSIKVSGAQKVTKMFLISKFIHFNIPDYTTMFIKELFKFFDEVFDLPYQFFGIFFKFFFLIKYSILLIN